MREGEMSDIKGVIFDLDGVIVSTDEYHYQAWRQLALDEEIPFSRTDNERLRGVGRMESLDILLERSIKKYSAAEKLALADRKNRFFRESLSTLTPAAILPGVLDLLDAFGARGIKRAIGSSSKNARMILEAIGLIDRFDAVVDGTCIERSKPDPQVFQIAAGLLSLPAAQCLVVEDADVGVEAALAAGMPVLGISGASGHPGASLHAADLAHISADEMLCITA